MKPKFVRMLLIVWPCVACLWLAALPPIFAQESKPLAKTPDIQGTWDLVSWEKNGEKQKLPNVQFFITALQIHADGAPGPDDRNFGLWHYQIGPNDKPNVANMDLSGAQGRDRVPGICELDGATLRIVLAKLTRTGARPLAKGEDDRPMEFATKPGTDQILFVLKRAAEADDPILRLRKLGSSEINRLWGNIYLDGERAKNDDLALIKKLPGIGILSLRRCQITDAGLVHLKDMADLQYLTLDAMPITDAGLVHLEGLPKLIDLEVNCAKVSGAGLERLTRLKSLEVQDSAFTDADLAHLRGLTKLERLDLSNTAITDAGLAHLEPLINLDRLFLEKTKVTDAGLEHLKGLTRLRILRIKGTKVTDKGVRALKAAIPGIEDVVR